MYSGEELTGVRGFGPIGHHLANPEHEEREKMTADSPKGFS